MLFPLGEVIDEEIRYLSDALLFFCSECTKPHFPSPIVLEQQETRLFRSKLQNFFQLRPFLKTASCPFPCGRFANMPLAVCGLSLAGFSTHTALRAVSHTVRWDDSKVCTPASALRAGSAAWLPTSPTPGLHLVSTSCDGKELPRGLFFSFPHAKDVSPPPRCEISPQPWGRVPAGRLKKHFLSLLGP